jgi:peptide/nickel transport system substrate-binding protein
VSPSRSAPFLLAALALALPTAAPAASRARFGGTLKLALAGREPTLDPLLADAPADAALASLVAPPICRLDAAQRVRPLLASELVRSGPLRVRVGIRPGLSSAGAPVGPQEIFRSWSRLTQAQTLSPYRALLYPLRGELRLAIQGHSPGSLELNLGFPWPDLEKSLCHPALGIVDPRTGAPVGLGAYTPTEGRGLFVANPYFPEGRPYPDRLSVIATNERGAARQLALKQVHAVIGAVDDAASSGQPPALFATYLAFTPARVGPELRQLFESSVDRSDLTRFFVRAPSVPMHQLLPPALMPQQPLPRPAPPAGARPRELALLYDASLEDQKAVAERIQVKLHDRGLKVSLKGLSRAELRAHWAKADYDLMLHALLLPPVAGPALAVVMEAAGRRDLLPVELPAIGAVSDAPAREAKARERAEALRPTLPFIPLYAQALRAQVSTAVSGLTLDAQGLPLLDQLFLTE